MKSELRHGPCSRYVAEIIGTFFLVLTVGCCVHTNSLVASLSIGGMLMVMVYSLGSVSGGHFNPAVTLAIMLSKRHKITPHEALRYIVSQCVGSTLAALIYYWLFRTAFYLQPLGAYSASQAMALEILFTSALCYVVLNVATTTTRLGNGENGFFGMAIGFTVVSSAIAMGNVSGCSLNPAVSVGAMVAGYLAHGIVALRFWALYIFGPFFGGVVGYLLFWMVQGGFTQRYEFPDTLEVDDFEEPEPVVQEPVVIRTREIDHPPAPAPAPPLPKPIYKRRDSIELFRGNVQRLPADLFDHQLVLGLKWRIRDLGVESETCDIDASCAKYDKTGRSLGAVYFAMKSDEDNGIFHSGDECTGASLEAGGIMGEEDNEQIMFQLDKIKKKVHCLFFVATIFSSGTTNFQDVEELSVRVLDATDGGREYCRFDKQDVSSGNALVVAMLYRSQGGWCFKPIDEAHSIQEHGTYRALEPYLQPYVRKILE